MELLPKIAKGIARVEVKKSRVRITPVSGEQSKADAYVLENHDQLLAEIARLCEVGVFRFLSHSTKNRTDRKVDQVSWRVERICDAADYYAAFNARTRYSRGSKKGKCYSNPSQFNLDRGSILLSVFRRLGGSKKVPPSDLWRKLSYLKRVWFRAELSITAYGEITNKLDNRSIVLIDLDHEVIEQSAARAGVFFGLSKGLERVNFGLIAGVNESAGAHENSILQRDLTACDNKYRKQLTVNRSTVPCLSVDISSRATDESDTISKLPEEQSSDEWLEEFESSPGLTGSTASR